MRDNDTSSFKTADSSYNATKAVESNSSNTTPDFMIKFTSESNKIIEEGGVEFFKPFKPNLEAGF
jgi:hypothetical protein